jgi:hypothetical protein
MRYSGISPESRAGAGAVAQRLAAIERRRRCPFGVNRSLTLSWQGAPLSSEARLHCLGWVDEHSPLAGLSGPVFFRRAAGIAQCRIGDKGVDLGFWQSDFVGSKLRSLRRYGGVT